MPDSKHLYKSGLTFDQDLARNLMEQKNDRINNNFPSLICIDGGQGEGKTTLLTHIIDYVNKLEGLPPCDLSIKHHPQIALGGKEFTKQFNECKKEGLPIIGYDEAGDFTKRGAISGFNARLIRRFETFRSSNIMVVLVLPNFGILDQHILDLQILRGLIHLRDRMVTKTYGNYYSYSGVQAGWIRYWMDKLPKPLRYQAYDKSEWSFRGHFKDLPPARSKELGRLSDYGKDREDLDAEVKFEGLLTYSDLARKVGMSIDWCRKAISKLKIQEDRIIKRIKYFRGDVINLLADHKDSTGAR